MVNKFTKFESYGISNSIKIFFIISMLVVIFDQATKYFAVHFSYFKLVIIPKLLWFTLIENEGAAFGMFSGRPYILGLVNILVVLLIIFYNFKKKLSLNEYFPLALIVGGALGNAIDRLFFGSVIDFLDLGWFPVFNVADSFIVIGFGWLLVNEFILSRNKN